jgi:hypothetical protein
MIANIAFLGSVTENREMRTISLSMVAWIIVQMGVSQPWITAQ